MIIGVQIQFCVLNFDSSNYTNERHVANYDDDQTRQAEKADREGKYVKCVCIGIVIALIDFDKFVQPGSKSIVGRGVVGLG